MYKEIYNQKGSMTIEATLVVPIVMIVVFMLFYLCLIQIQQAVMYMQAVNMSKKICNNIIFPGYEQFYDLSSDFDAGEKDVLLDYNFSPSKDFITDVFSTHDPYRYLIGIHSKNYDDYENELNDIFSGGYFLPGGNVTTDISSESEGLSSLIRVSISYEFNLPKFIEIIGIDSKLVLNSQAVSYIGDHSEFVRNIDLAFDLTNFLLEKYNLKDKIDSYYKKIIEFGKLLL